MNINQLKQDLKDLEEGLDELPEEFKDDVRQEIKDLKEQIKDAEKEEAAKDKLKSAAEKKIEKIEDKIKSPKTPVKVKATLKKSLESVKKVVKEAVKEDVKERKAKPIAKKKKASPTGGKRGRPKKVATPKKVVKRKSKATMKYERALTNLQKLVNKDKELREKYKGKGVDLDRDASRKAKPFGWRLRGDNYRRPTKAEIKSGEAYFEKRPERADVKRTTYPRLEDGGMMAKGGRTKKRTKAQLLADKRLKAKKPGKRTSESGEVYYESRENRSDVNRTLRLAKGGITEHGLKINDKIVNYDGNMLYIDNKEKMFSVDIDKGERKQLNEKGGMMAKGGRTKKRTKASIIADKRYKALKPGKRVSESGNVYYESRPEHSDLNRRDRI